MVRGDMFGRTLPEGLDEEDRDLAPTGPLAFPAFRASPR